MRYRKVACIVWQREGCGKRRGGRDANPAGDDVWEVWSGGKEMSIWAWDDVWEVWVGWK